MKKRLLKTTALVLCGLLAFQGSITPALASEKVPPETTHEEVIDETDRRAGWTSAWVSYGPGDDSDYLVIERGSGTVNTGHTGITLTVGAADYAMQQVLKEIDPAVAAGIEAVLLLLTITPQLIVDGFEKYAPFSADLDYTYTKAKNVNDSTGMYEYYRYEVVYIIGNQKYPQTFYETRTFN